MQFICRKSGSEWSSGNTDDRYVLQRIRPFESVWWITVKHAKSKRVDQMHLHTVVLCGLNKDVIDMCIEKTVANDHQFGATRREVLAKLLQIPTEKRIALDGVMLVASHDKKLLCIRIAPIDGAVEFKYGLRTRMNFELLSWVPGGANALVSRQSSPVGGRHDTREAVSGPPRLSMDLDVVVQLKQ